MPDAALADRLAAVRQQVADAARAARRDPAGITTIVVTKFQPIGLIRGLHELGVRDFGESRHPEARDKAVALPDATWHFIGQLQTNKARQVARYAGAVHSVDRPQLADALAGREGDPLDVLLQLDLGGDVAGRGGAGPADAERLATRILTLPTLRLRGVMAVAPQSVAPAEAFGRLAEAASTVRALAPAATWISAGMSGDFGEAIAAGATHLRIGTAITGNRPAGR